MDEKITAAAEFRQYIHNIESALALHNLSRIPDDVKEDIVRGVKEKIDFLKKKYNIDTEVFLEDATRLEKIYFEYSK